MIYHTSYLIMLHDVKMFLDNVPFKKRQPNPQVTISGMEASSSCSFTLSHSVSVSLSFSSLSPALSKSCRTSQVSRLSLAAGSVLIDIHIRAGKADI